MSLLERFKATREINIGGKVTSVKYISYGYNGDFSSRVVLLENDSVIPGYDKEPLIGYSLKAATADGPDYSIIIPRDIIEYLDGYSVEANDMLYILSRVTIARGDKKFKNISNNNLIRLFCMDRNTPMDRIFIHYTQIMNIAKARVSEKQKFFINGGK